MLSSAVQRLQELPNLCTTQGNHQFHQNHGCYLRADQTCTCCLVLHNSDPWVPGVFYTVPIAQALPSSCTYYQRNCLSSSTSFYASPSPPTHLLELCFWLSGASSFHYFPSPCYN